MNSKVLTQANATISGSNLWVLPLPTNSEWSTKIDWYLNGQLTRSEQRSPQVLSSELLRILKEEEIDFEPSQTNKNSPLLISSESLIPNKQTLIIPYNGSVKDWVASIQTSWKQLGSPTLRIFLPSTLKASYFLENFPKLNFSNAPESLHLTLVEDSAKSV